MFIANWGFKHEFKPPNTSLPIMEINAVNTPKNAMPPLIPSTMTEATQGGSNALADDSIFGAAAPQRDAAYPAEPHESLVPSTSSPSVAASRPIWLPLLGTRLASEHLRTLLLLLALVSAALALLAYQAFNGSKNMGEHVTALNQALFESQRLSKAAQSALLGDASAANELKQSQEQLSKSLQEMRANPDLSAADAERIGNAGSLLEKLQKSSASIVGKQAALQATSAVLKSINKQSTELLETTDTIAALKLQNKAPATEIAASGQMVMLTQRIGKSASEFLTMDGVSPEAVFLLGKDLNTFKELATGLRDGSAVLKTSAEKTAGVRERLDAALQTHENTRKDASVIITNLQSIVEARDAYSAIAGNSEALRKALEPLKSEAEAEGGVPYGLLWGLIGLGLLALGLGLGVAYVQVQEGRLQTEQAQREQLVAQDQELAAKRLNDTNQAAILRLMNELQSVADGDLTKEATVTEDITGAIADSVNYTVEELRALVTQVKTTALSVAQTTEKVEQTSTNLLVANTQQMAQIRQNGLNVQEMAKRMNAVSGQAQMSVAEAEKSVQVADRGLLAVQNSINGMAQIRTDIQDTSKRIKRLGESSQQIGEITSLISDITEQTNILALNAAIQAAAAGEAGRGFSVIAEEVQRLAERSATATRQIAALVKTIQTDTQDAIVAMERSTSGVVEGAKLADNAGTSLTEINAASRNLAGLINEISHVASKEALAANQAATEMQTILTSSENSMRGTQLTAEQARDLAKVADALRASVARFTV